MSEKYPEDRIFRYQSLINELRSEIEGTIDQEKIEYLSSEIYYLERMIENAQQERQASSERFHETLKRAKKEVDKWPEWKKSMLNENPPNH